MANISVGYRRIAGPCLLAGAAIGAIALAAPAAPAATQVQSTRLTQGSLTLARALQRIGQHFGVTISYNSTDIAAAQARPVRGATSAYDAVVQATDGTGLSYERTPDGGIRVYRRENSGDEVIVIATRDEAETNLNINSGASSTRTGKSLREQPRSTTVVGAKLIEDQQVQSVQEALRNVSGTTATGGTQGIPTFTVRGYRADALTNGLAVAGGSAQPVAGLERIEVLKGPDAVLAGADNQGGVVNIVTKRPTATPLLNVAVEYASFDDKRITIDASNALNDSRTLSARVVGTAAKAEQNFQNYAGREEYLFAPSLRYKDGDSDLIVGLSASSIFAPIPVATIIDKTSTDVQVIRPLRRSPLGPRRQGVQLDVARYYFNFSHRATNWLTLVARGEHADTSQDLGVYLPGFAAQVASTNQYVYFPTEQRLENKSDAFDYYARLTFATGPVRHSLTGGFNHSRQKQTTLYPTSTSPQYQFNLLTGEATSFPPPFNPVTPVSEMKVGTVPNFFIPIRQTGYYIQDFVELGRLKVLAALRLNKYQTGITFFSPAQIQFNGRQNYSSTLPSVGVVYDVLDTVSVYANYQRGYSPGLTNSQARSTVPGAFTGAIFPDNKTRNIEGGVKLDLFGKRLAVVAAYYENRQSNVTDTSTVPGAAFVVPGQEGKGVEVDVTGRILPGLSIAASASRTKFSVQQLTPVSQVVRAQPEFKYSLFLSYEPTNGTLRGFGASAGIYGQSNSFAYSGLIDPTSTTAAIASRGAFYNGTRRANGTLLQQATAAGTIASFRPFTPASRQVDANLYYTLGIARLTVGVKNLFDRVNYSPTLTSDFYPVQTPRTYRATLAFRFY